MSPELACHNETGLDIADNRLLDQDDKLSVENLRREQNNDATISRIKMLLQASDGSVSWADVVNDTLEVQTLFAQRQTLEIRDDVLYRKFQKVDGSILYYQAVIPKSLRITLLSHLHGGRMTGHFGQFKTEKRVAALGYWHRWKTDVSLFVKSCEKCNRFKRGLNVRQGLLKHASVNSAWQKVHVDLMGPFVKSRDGYFYLLTAVCAFTKYLVAIPLRSKSAFEVARALVRQVFLVFSPVEILVHDNGLEFVNSLLSEINSLMDIQSCRVTRYRPSGNGICERSHATLNKLFATSVQENQKNWTDNLPYVVYAYNTAYHSSTTFSPFYLMFLRQPRIGIDLICDETVEEKISTREEYAMLMRERMQNAYRLVHQHLNTAFERAKRRYDLRVRECQFKGGDLVWYYSPRRYRNRTSKWLLQTSGPYEIVRRINDVNYVIRRSARQSAFTVHVDRLRPYRPSLNEGRENTSTISRGDVNPGEGGEDDNSDFGARPKRKQRLPSRFEQYTMT